MTHPKTEDPPKKRTLNDRFLKSLKPALKGETYDVMDIPVPGYGVRVSETGRKTLILIARYPGSKNPTRRKLGLYGVLTASGGRDMARDWLELIRKGKDPQVEEERQRIEAERNRANSFPAAVEQYIRHKVIGADPAHPLQRRGHRVARELRLLAQLPVWNGKVLSEIDRADIQNIVKDVRDHGLRGMLAIRGVTKGKLAAHRGDGHEGARNVLTVLKPSLLGAYRSENSASSPRRQRQ